MTIALATRGYICHCPAAVIAQGPTIIAATQPQPEVTGTAETVRPAPKVRGGRQVSPTVQSAAEPVQAPPTKPSKGKGKKVSPTIRGAKKE